MRKFPNTRRRNRRGAVVVLAGFLMVVMLAMIAFALDIGYIALAKTELQNAADASAVAGVAGLIDSESEAIQQAKIYAQSNRAASRDVEMLPGQDIVLGVWDANSRAFQPLSSSSGSTPNAVQVTTRVASDRGNEARLIARRVEPDAILQVTAGCPWAELPKARGDLFRIVRSLRW